MLIKFFINLYILRSLIRSHPHYTFPSIIDILEPIYKNSNSTLSIYIRTLVSCHLILQHTVFFVYKHIQTLT